VNDSSVRLAEGVNPILTVERPELAEVSDEKVLEDAFHARRRGDYKEALERFLTVFQRDRTNPFVLIEAARCEGARLRIAAMGNYLAAAEKLAEGDAMVFQMTGDAWLTFHLPEQSLAAYRTAYALAPQDAGVVASLLAAFERANLLAEAEALLTSLPAATRREPALQLVRVALARRAKRHEKALEWAGLFLRQARLAPFAEAQMLREAALAEDALSHPDVAWAKLLESKALLAALPEGEYQRKLFGSHVEFLRQIGAGLTPRHLTVWRAQAAACVPRRIAFLLGHPRSGTTVLERILDAHPEVTAASEYPTFELGMSESFQVRPGEAPALLEDQLAGMRERYWETMEGVLPEPIGGRLLLDKNPGLTDGVHGILRIFPEAKLLVMLRDPRDVLLSCFFQDFGWSRLGVACQTLEGAVAAWETTMRHWVTVRPLLDAEQFREFRYEEFVSAPERGAEELLQFLGCAPTGGGLSTASALAKSGFIRTPTYAQVGEKVRTDAVARWRPYARHFEPFRERLEPLFEALGYRW
jgi:tetratricopeptide (TPR) repeat protein